MWGVRDGKQFRLIVVNKDGTSPGVTEMYVHPAVDTPELRAFAPDWAARVDDHDLITGHSTLPALAARAGATLIGYREIRDLQRAAAA